MNRWAIITGAAGGIGQALVKTFSENGYKIIAIDLLQMPENLSCEHYLQVDLEKTVNNEEYAKNIFAQIQELVGSDELNTLINNAAIQILGGVDSLTRQDWQTSLNTNLIAPFIWTQALLPQLEKANGSALNISSIHARLTKKNFVAYATSKAALSGLARSMAVDLGPRIRVNAIEPAAIDTEMLRAGFVNKQAAFAELKYCHPVQDIGNPTEVAQLALAITSGSMKFLHGACISLDGGISSRLHDPE